MSEQPEIALKSRLLQLKCHFTWGLLEKDADIDGLEERLYNQLTFLATKNKYMVYNLLAYVMHLKGDYAKAVSNLEDAEEKIKENNPNGIPVSFLVTFGNYAWVHYHLKRYEDSQNYIDKIEQINSGLQLLLDDRQDIADIYGEQGWSLLTFCRPYYKKAKECFEKALELDPEDPEWNTGYATAVYRLETFKGKKWPAAQCRSLPLLKRAIELDPNDAVLKALLALKLQDLKRADEGRKYVEEALEQAPNLPYVLRYVAKFYRKAKLVDEALRVLKTAVDLMPTSAFLHHQIGLCYKQKMNKKNIRKEVIEKVIFHFEKALEYEKCFMYGQNLANMYSKAAEYQKAEDTFKMILTFTNITDVELQQIHLDYGHFQEHIKKSESEAIKQYKKGFQIAKPSQYRKSCENALKSLAERKIQSDPSDALGYGLLGFIYKKNGKTSEAIESYEKALIYDLHNEEYLNDLCDLKFML
ncbi:interferon-induced protein with tetratricopeptide repeats 5-like [Mixophyes fleayi]|uniref:interferon-induced protein with tetratricopeptide repeats 5-like n=1 Tax=Mixophyes fleayi TaxID=3061075 RepID=UPI003F4E2FE7